MLSSEQLAIKIVQDLTNAGFLAYFAGGWVRDYLMGNSSSDIDIATNASPQQITALFPKTIQVGVAFGVVIVVLEGKNFEISTFRKDLDYQDGRHPTSISFSNAEEDAKRRDFTINGMFFDPLNEQVLDFVEGVNDLKRGIIRTIGNPQERFLEDRLRMIRAVRFATRFGFAIEKTTREAIIDFASSLFPAVSIERIWQELTKMSKLSEFHSAIHELFNLQLLKVIFPNLSLTSQELENRIAKFDQFPSNCPTIIYIQELFPSYSLENRLELCRYLKTPNSDTKIVEFYHHSLDLLNRKPLENYEWAHFYAHPYAELMLEIMSTKESSPEQFLHEHEKRQQGLFSHILRIQNKTPLITSSMLIEEGVAPGKELGQLLKKAERLAINENINDALVIIKKLPLFN